MFSNFRRTIALAALGMMILSTAGCVPLLVGAAAGAGIAYVKGTLEANFDRPVKTVHKASVAALKVLKLEIKDEDVSQHSSEIKAEYQDGIKVNIKTEALTEHTSKISIRIGVFGDQTKSEMILDAIKKRL